MADSLLRLADRTQNVGCFADTKRGSAAVTCPHHHLIRPDTLTPIYPTKKKKKSLLYMGGVECLTEQIQLCMQLTYQIICLLVAD
jgi:hypothetical protein